MTVFRMQQGYRLALRFALAKIKELAAGMAAGDGVGQRKLLERCAMTSLNSKLIRGHRTFFGPMIVDAVTSLDKYMALRLIGIKKVPGGSVTERSCHVYAKRTRRSFT